MENIREHYSPILYTGGAALATYFLHRKWKSYRKQVQLQSKRHTRLVVITGCDSGLGLSMALWAAQLGYNVLAGCYNGEEGAGAKILMEKDNNKITVAQLDLTCPESIHNFRLECERLLKESGCELWALISNAGVLVCGEFFWQTEEQWHRQVNVNFWGAVNLTKEFQPLLFYHQSRLIIISSDCSKISLPGLAIYAASKSALESWCRALRLEIGKYGVKVVSYQPGSFAFSSQILAGSKNNYEEMEGKMSQVDEKFYGEYFKGWKEAKCKLSDGLPSIKPLESKRHKNDLRFLLEGEIKHTPVIAYETFFQQFLLFAEKYFPRVLSDKILNLTMNGRANDWTLNESYSQLFKK